MWDEGITIKKKKKKTKKFLNIKSVCYISRTFIFGYLSKQHAVSNPHNILRDQQPRSTKTLEQTLMAAYISEVVILCRLVDMKI